MSIKNRQFKHPLTALLILAVAAAPLLYVHFASAGALSKVFVRFDRMAASTITTGTVCAKPSTTATEAHVQVTFPTGYTLGANTTFTVTTTNLAWPLDGVTTPTAWPGIGTATLVSGQTVTFPSTDLTLGTMYCFNWDNVGGNAVTVKSSATASNLGSVTTQDSVPATIDTAEYTTASILSDQFNVTATVPTAFSFTLTGGTTDALGNLTAGTIKPSPSPHSAQISTNAQNGWLVWAKDSSTGLHSTTASHTIPSITPGTPSVLSTSAEGYNTGVTASQLGGTGTLNTASYPFDGGSLGKGGGLDTTLRTIASSTGTADTATVLITNNVNAIASTPAASDYTDTITLTGAGLF